MAIDHWMTFATFTEQRYFAYPREARYRGVIFNANMVAHAPEGIAAFLMSKTGGLAYLIDPLTHAFQHDVSAIQNKERELKSSIAVLAERYGLPVSETAGKRPSLPTDFVPGDILDGFVDRCFAFQRQSLSATMAASEWNQYLLYEQPELEPYALVSPYFFITEANSRRWLPIGVRMAAAAYSRRGNSKIFLPIVISRGVLLDPELRNAIVTFFAQEQMDGYLLWVDDMNETEVAGNTLAAFLDLARRLRRRPDQEIINLHGGYFSILSAGTLGKGALTGVSHGPEFGEHRGVVPVGGGIPRPKFYIPKLHARIPYREAQNYLNRLGYLDSAETFFENVCDCSECRTVLSPGIANFVSYGDTTVKLVRRDRGFTRMEFPTSVAKQQCLRHYLERKAMECEFATRTEGASIVEDLRRGYLAFRDVAPETCGHLAIWAKVLAGEQFENLN